jgi:hypothetical protein
VGETDRSGGKAAGSRSDELIPTPCIIPGSSGERGDGPVQPEETAECVIVPVATRLVLAFDSQTLVLVPGVDHRQRNIQRDEERRDKERNRAPDGSVGVDSHPILQRGNQLKAVLP